MSAKIENGELDLKWIPTVKIPWLWVVQKEIDGKWTTEILGPEKESESVKTNLLEVVAVTTVGRSGALSSPAIYRVGN